MKTKEIQELYNYSVLFAEDEKGLREEIKEILECLFKKTYLANDGVEALHIYNQYKPDLIITDIKMPKLSGLELIKSIRRQDDITCICIISAYTNLDFVLLATELNLLKYIIKPITKSKLNLVFQKFLNKKQVNLSIKLSNNYIFNKNNKSIINDNKVYKLSYKEDKFLNLLLSKKSIITYEEIEYILETQNFNSEHSIRQFIKKIRKKLPKHYLNNLQNQGYIISNDFL